MYERNYVFRRGVSNNEKTKMIKGWWEENLSKGRKEIARIICRKINLYQNNCPIKPLSQKDVGFTLTDKEIRGAVGQSEGFWGCSSRAPIFGGF